MAEYAVFRNKNVDLTKDELYDMVREREHKIHGYEGQNFANFQDNVSYKKPKKHRVQHSDIVDVNYPLVESEQPKKSFWKSGMTIVWMIILFLAVLFILYLSIYRYGLAGKSLYNGNTMTGLALLSPEIGSLLRFGLM